MFAKTSVPIDIIEVERFKTHLQNKELYEMFLEELKTLSVFKTEEDYINYFIQLVKPVLGREFDGDCETDFRAVTKQRLLATMNARNNSDNYILEQIAFNKMFPNIHEFIQAIKIENHKNFCYLMFHIESYFMLDIVARKINNKFRRKIPVLTLHDCIITTQSNLQTVKNHMKQILSESLGFEPRVSESYYV